MFVLESFRATLTTYSNNARIYNITNHMVINNQVDNFNGIYQLLMQGVTPGLIC